MTESAHLRLLCADQRERWRRGDRARVESYLEREPGLCDRSEALLDLIYNEVLLREEAGERPAVSDYADRFPKLADQIRLQFHVHQALEDGSLARSRSDDDLFGRAMLGTGAGGPHPRVAGYEILGELGRGGMGVVYKARQVALKRDVALKIVLAGSHASPSEKDRFRTEAEAVARLRHPNVVQVYEVGEQDGCPFLALELVDGPSLEALAREDLPEPGSAAVLVEVLARAAHAAHESGVIHRDLKPANVLFAPNQAVTIIAPTENNQGQRRWTLNLSLWTPKIVDFGLAKLAGGDNRQTATHAFLGTPSYMAPEQAAGRARDIDRRADVFSLGAILYELLTGRPPFDGASLLETMDRVRAEEPAPPARLRRGVPRDLETICLKCLRKEPAARYQTALELADDLHRFLAREPVRARPARPAERFAKWFRRHPTYATLAGAGLISVAALITGLVWHQADALSRQRRGSVDALTAVADARARYQQFTHRLDEALFRALYRTAFTDTAGSGTGTLQVVAEALAVVGISADGGQFRPDPLWTAEEQATARAGCQRLLEALADASARTRRGAPADERSRRARSALDVLDVAAQLAPPTQAWHLRRARLLRQAGEASAADREAALAARLRPTAAADFFALGQEALDADPRAAAAHFHSAVAREPRDFWCWLLLGVALARQGAPAEARAAFDRSQELRPGFAWVYVLRGQSAAALGEAEPALKDYAHALRLTSEPDVQYAVHAGRGALHFAAKRDTESAADFAAAITIDPSRAAAHASLAHVRMRQGRAAEATAEFAEAIRLQPASLDLDLEPRLWSALRMRPSGRLEEALHACDHAIQAQPNLAVTHGLRGLTLLGLGRFADAAQAFDRYEALGGPPALDFFRGRGRARMALRDFAGARDDYERALALRADTPGYLGRGWAYFFCDSWKLALRDFDAALSRDPESADALVGRGLCRAKLGDATGAVDDSGAALRRGVDTPEMMHNIACAFALAAGNSGERTSFAADCRHNAIAALERAVGMLPEARQAAFWRTQMRSDAALDSIRGSPEFRLLDRRLTGGADPGS